MASAVHQSGSNASETPLRIGSDVIPSSGATAGYKVVNDVNITANSVVVCWGVGNADTTALTFSADTYTDGASFVLRSNATPTANKTVGYAILRY